MKIIAISAGQLDYKKETNAIRKRIKYLNYGLLGLTTLIHENLPVDIIMFQANDLLPERLLEYIEDSGVFLKDYSHILLSIPSFYSVSWCKQFCEIVKSIYRIKIIAGGRWVINGNINWLKEKIGNIDEYIEGFGEKKIIRLLGGDTHKIADGSVQCFDKLDYTLLHDYANYQPCIEVSRGCGAGCNFCADKSSRRLPNKGVDKIVKELKEIDSLYPKYTYYMEAPHFHFETKWIHLLHQELCNDDVPHYWRCTSRVESVPLGMLKELAETGLKVIDIGLESASLEQLTRMGKSIEPQKYLDKAERILEACKENCIWVKFNLLLYAGETYKTLEETKVWLQKHSALIKDVSVSNLVYYKNMGNINELINNGASIPKGEAVDESGYLNLNLSDEISYDIAKVYAIQMPKIVANQRDFYDIKSITYFSPDYSYTDFLNDLKRCDARKLPFRVEKVIL